MVAELGRVERLKVAFAQLGVLARPFGDCGVEEARESWVEPPREPERATAPGPLPDPREPGGGQRTAERLPVGPGAERHLLAAHDQRGRHPLSAAVRTAPAGALRSWMTQAADAAAPPVRLRRGPVPPELAGLGGHQRHPDHRPMPAGPTTRPASRRPGESGPGLAGAADQPTVRPACPVSTPGSGPGSRCCARPRAWPARFSCTSGRWPCSSWRYGRAAVPRHHLRPWRGEVLDQPRHAGGRLRRERRQPARRRPERGPGASSRRSGTPPPWTPGPGR